jgi:hypothetical protein
MVTAATAAVEIADLPATTNDNKAEQNASKTIRNKACIRKNRWSECTKLASIFLANNEPTNFTLS